MLSVIVASLMSHTWADKLLLILTRYHTIMRDVLKVFGLMITYLPVILQWFEEFDLTLLRLWTPPITSQQTSI